MREPAIIKSRFEIPIPSTNVIEYIFGSTEGSKNHWTPNQPIILSADDLDFPGYTFDEIKRLVQAFACGLWNKGVEGKRVIIYGLSCHDVPIIILGCLGAGAIVHLSHPLPTWEALGRFESIEPEYVFVATEFREDISRILLQMKRQPLHVYEVDSTAGTRKNRYVYNHWTSLLDLESGPTFQWPQLPGEKSKITPALIINTSGTTGTAKQTERSHYGLIGNTEQLIYRYNLKPRGRELFFCNFGPAGIGFMLYGLLVPLKARYGTIWMNKFSLETYLGAVKKFKPTALHSPKHILHELITHTAGADFSSVTSMRTGGAYIPCSMREAWRRLHGSDCEVVCGMTEGGIYFASDPSSPIADESVGELLPNLEAKIVDDTGNVLGRNETGEIWIKSPFAMTGYCNNPEETAQAFSSDGWLKTGDIGRVNEDNKWYICGRKKDLFKPLGRHVSALRIEHGMMEHPQIVDVVVVSVAAPGNEPEPRAYVVKELNSKLTPEVVRSWVKRELGPELYPTAGIEFLDSLPYTPTGKVDRGALRSRANKGSTQSLWEDGK